VNTEPEAVIDPTTAPAIDPAKFRPRLTLAESRRVLAKREASDRLEKYHTPLVCICIIATGIPLAQPLFLIAMMNNGYTIGGAQLWVTVATIALNTALWAILVFKSLIPRYDLNFEIAIRVVNEAQAVIAAAEAADATSIQNRTSDSEPSNP
jgi:hypothetical protein